MEKWVAIYSVLSPRDEERPEDHNEYDDDDEEAENKEDEDVKDDHDRDNGKTFQSTPSG